jgi:hypothetical protein
MQSPEFRCATPLTQSNPQIPRSAAPHLPAPRESVIAELPEIHDVAKHQTRENSLPRGPVERLDGCHNLRSFPFAATAAQRSTELVSISQSTNASRPTVIPTKVGIRRPVELSPAKERAPSAEADGGADIALVFKMAATGGRVNSRAASRSCTR